MKKMIVMVAMAAMTVMAAEDKPICTNMGVFPFGCNMFWVTNGVTNAFMRFSLLDHDLWFKSGEYRPAGNGTSIKVSFRYRLTVKPPKDNPPRISVLNGSMSLWNVHHKTNVWYDGSFWFRTNKKIPVVIVGWVGMTELDLADFSMKASGH